MADPHSSTSNASFTSFFSKFPETLIKTLTASLLLLTPIPEPWSFVCCLLNQLSLPTCLFFCKKNISLPSQSGALV
ncbi:hypothetical protein PanWU01x14_150720, partial [Parasponia andersonii]